MLETWYLANSEYPLPSALNAISSWLAGRAKRTGPASTRAQETPAVAGLVGPGGLAGLRVDAVEETSIGQPEEQTVFEHRRIELRGQLIVAPYWFRDEFFPSFSTFTALVPRPWPVKITVSPSTIGVAAL